MLFEYTVTFEDDSLDDLSAIEKLMLLRIFEDKCKRMFDAKELSVVSVSVNIIEENDEI